MSDEDVGERVRVAVRGFFVFFMAISWYDLWLLFAAPRDPGGMLCDAASPLRSIGVMLRGQREVGCPWHDKPIHAVHGLMGGRRDE